MNFLLTQYFYPLKEKKILSNKLKFTLDNPRTEEEISIVKEYIKKSNEGEDGNGWPPNNEAFGSDEFVTIENTLNKFKSNYESVDNYIKIFYEQNSQKDIYEFLAKLIVIIRFDDGDEYEALKMEYEKIRTNSIPALVLLSDDSKLITNSNLLIEYCYLLSLLTHTSQNDYMGESFLIDQYDGSYAVKPSRYFNSYFTMFITFAYSSFETIQSDKLKWKFYLTIIGEMLEYSQILDKAFENDKVYKKLIYIANVLRNVGDSIKDKRLKLVTLVSIIEMLITHNPNTNRFNVEDSISKQFQLKTSIVIYLYDKGQDIDVIKNKLKLIYNLRSNIAHGNFESISKTLNKMYPFYKEQIEYIDAKDDYEIYLEIIVCELYKFIKILILSFLNDTEFIDFLKNN